MNVIARKYENIPIVLNINDSVERLSILVENQGRINYGIFMDDTKVGNNENNNENNTSSVCDGILSFFFIKILS